MTQEEIKERFKSSTHQYYKHIFSLPIEELKRVYQCLCSNCNWIKRHENKEDNRYKE